MNYAKVVGAALQLFPKKIKVTLVHATTGNLLGTYKLDKTQLPQRFNKPLIITIDNKKWQVMKAEPSSDKDYLSSKKLALHVQQAEVLQLSANRFLVPTVANALPPLSEDELFNDFIINMDEYNWRQIEFLPASLLPVIHEEIKIIEPILKPAMEENLLLGFTSRHVRNKVGGQNLSIPFPEFLELVNASEKGAVRFTYAFDGSLQNSFAISSSNYTYYGLVQANYITELCLPAFDCVDDEFINVVDAYGLVLVDWCNGIITMAGSNDETPPADTQEISDELLPLS